MAGLKAALGLPEAVWFEPCRCGLRRQRSIVSFLGFGWRNVADGLDADLGQTFSVLDRQVLAAAVTVMDGPAAVNWPLCMQGLVEGIEYEAGIGGPRDPPPDDVTGIDIDDEGDGDEARPGGDIGEVGNPDAFANELAPDLARPVSPEIVGEHPRDLRLQGQIRLRPRRQPRRIRTSGENLFVVLIVIDPTVSGVGAFGNPRAVQSSNRGQPPSRGPA